MAAARQSTGSTRFGVLASRKGLNQCQETSTDCQTENEQELSVEQYFDHFQSLAFAELAELAAVAKDWQLARGSVVATD